MSVRVRHLQEVESQVVQMEGASGCAVRWLLGQSEGAPNFAMRYFEVAPGGHTPHHDHPYEHEVYVLQGHGVVMDGAVERPLRPGDAVYVPPGDTHQFRNTGATPLKFLCLVPHAAGATRSVVAPECGENQ